MKAMSADSVKRLALAHGGKLSIDGRVVNSARLQVVAGPKQAPEPAYMRPEPTPPEPLKMEQDPVLREALVSIDNFAASQFLLNDQNMKLMNTVKDMLQSVSDRPAEKRPRKWVFSVKRDAQGLMETITAKATE